MAQNHNQKALEALQETLELLQAGQGRFGQAERYWRSWERSREYVSACRKASNYLELALEALEAPLRDSEDHCGRSWIARKVKGLAQYLAQNGDDDEELAGAAEDTGLSTRWAGKDHGKSLQGNGAVMELPDLIGMIGAQGMTGVLSLTLPQEVVQLHFEQGELVHAYSENAPGNMRLGEILVAQGAIERERLDSLLFCHENSPQMLGEILLGGGVVDPEALTTALGYQIQCLFDRLFMHRRQAQFRFVPGLPEATAQRAKVNVLGLLLESARNYDEGVGRAESA
ncbi:MAG: DUF4388 domain-containing protein [Planctomycetota bacterium]